MKFDFIIYSIQLDVKPLNMFVLMYYMFIYTVGLYAVDHGYIYTYMSLFVLK